jgi:hypothetical protein
MDTSSSMHTTTSSSNRRHNTRARIAIAVKKQIGEKVFLCQASDISPDGIHVASVLDRFHDQSQSCSLEFSLPGSDVVISAKGRVLRQTIHDRYHLTAIRFSAIAPSHRRLIQRYVDGPEVAAPSPPFIPSRS